jgi:hypothetical protein
MTALRQRMTEDMQVRNLALNTQTSYLQQVSLFARRFHRSPEELGPEEIRAYQVYLTNEKKLAPSSILIAVAALRFFTRSRSNGNGFSMRHPRPQEAAEAARGAQPGGSSPMRNSRSFSRPNSSL